ncbi:MAG: ABC transporter permease [Anaerolineae bacterium]|jgi:peptide/nickel transport system permease protein|nr:ABC transporter permease [Anaerolineae bacterium]MDX9830020.1 ABC transporter permease [Anaerolineae bacterium]
MALYVLRRLLMLLPILVGVSLLAFAILHVTPGDPAVLMLGQYATPDRITGLRQELGLDDPLHVQYGRYLWRALHGDLGSSFRSQRPVIQEILDRFPSTMQLTLTALFLSVIVGVSTGVLAATARNRWLDGGLMAGALVGLSIPEFWLGIVLLIVFGVKLKMVPITGGTGLRALILPSVTLALAPAAVLARLTRSSMLEVIREDYVRTAWAKGLGGRSVIVSHVLRNALIPVVTVLGLQFAGLLAGTVFIENVFARPGIGRLVVNAIAARDYPMVQGIVLFTATVYAFLNLAVDVLYGFLDPRIRYD